MNMKRSLILTIVIMMTYNMGAQTLSGAALGHYRAGKVLLENATSSEDYLSAAEEFETVIGTNPDYAELYPELINIYIKVGESKGYNYFDKADKLLRDYQNKFPEKVEDATYLGVMLKAAKNKWQNGPQRFCGKWQVLSPNLELTISFEEGKYKASVKPTINAHPVYVNEVVVNDNIITISAKDSWTHDPYTIYDKDDEACDGYSRTGTFYVDYAKREWKCKIILEGSTPTQTISYHVEYYYRDSKTWCCNGRLPQTTLKRR